MLPAIKVLNTKQKQSKKVSNQGVALGRKCTHVDSNKEASPSSDLR